MSTEIKIRRGTAAQNAAFTGAVGEVTYSTDEKRLITHDGATVGGTLQAIKSEVELVANKSNNTALGASATLYPTQNAVKSYADTGLALKVAKAGDTMTGTLTVSPAANTSAIVTSGTNTADAPSLNLAQTWNNAGVNFTGIKLNITNTASGAASRLVDLQIGAATKFSVDFNGALYAAGATLDLGLGTNASHTIKFYRPAAAGTNTIDFDNVGGTANLNILRKYTDSPFQMEFASSSGIDLILDSNNNETASLFRVLTNGIRDSGTQTLLLSLTESGTLTVAGGAITADAPVLGLTQTWNNGAVTFTGLKLNVTSAASAAASLLLDLQVATVSQFKVNKAGDTTALGTLTAGNTLFSVTGTTGVLRLGNGTNPAANPTNATTQWAVGGEWQYRSSAASEGAGQTNRVHNRAEIGDPNGADNANLTTTPGVISFDPGGGPYPWIITLPTAGTYLLIAEVGITSTGADNFTSHFYDPVAVAQLGKIARVSVPATSYGNMSLGAIFTIPASQDVEVWGFSDASSLGMADFVSSSMRWVRLY